MQKTTSFCAKDMLALGDCRVPGQTKQAIQGLLDPIERLFPDGRVPADEASALALVVGRNTPPSPLLELPFLKKDWTEWLQLEIETRLRFSVDFLGLRALVEKERDGAASPNETRPLVLFLREFREHTELSEARAFGFRNLEGDGLLRDRVERLLPDAWVVWIANGDDALSYSFYVWEGDDEKARGQLVGRINPNTVPYISRHENWLKCVRLLAEAADLIVMSNTKSDGGVAAEVTAIREGGHLEKTFFANPAALNLPADKSIDAIQPNLLERLSAGVHARLLDLPEIKAWAGPETLDYAAAYVGAIDRLWGLVQDNKKEISPSVFSAMWTSMATLMLVRGELKSAAELYEALAKVIRSRRGDFPASDQIAEEALRSTAQWYAANADLYCGTYLVAFDPPPSSLVRDVSKS